MNTQNRRVEVKVRLWNRVPFRLGLAVLLVTWAALAFGFLLFSRQQERFFAEQHIRQAKKESSIESMHAIEGLLAGEPENIGTPKAPYRLRRHKPGDMGWVIHRHGAIYALEYGWDMSFEALVADIAAGFIRKHNPKFERCWMAEKDREIVGSVFLVRKSKNVAQLRLLLVEPKARGIGLGARLVGECERFARQAGYRKIMLWTNSILHAARHIYEKAGYRLVQEEPHHSFGHDLVGQIWELKL